MLLAAFPFDRHALNVRILCVDCQMKRQTEMGFSPSADFATISIVSQQDLQGKPSLTQSSKDMYNRTFPFTSYLLCCTCFVQSDQYKLPYHYTSISPLLMMSGLLACTGRLRHASSRYQSAQDCSVSDEAPSDIHEAVQDFPPLTSRCHLILALSTIACRDLLSF